MPFLLAFLDIESSLFEFLSAGPVARSVCATAGVRAPRRSRPGHLIVVVLLQDTMACQTKNVGNYDDDEEDDKVAALDEGDIALLKAYGQGP